MQWWKLFPLFLEFAQKRGGSNYLKASDGYLKVPMKRGGEDKRAPKRDFGGSCSAQFLGRKLFKQDSCCHPKHQLKGGADESKPKLTEHEIFSKKNSNFSLHFTKALNFEWDILYHSVRVTQK
jgi:hypothetical protein